MYYFIVWDIRISVRIRIVLGSIKYVEEIKGGEG